MHLILVLPAPLWLQYTLLTANLGSAPGSLAPAVTGSFRGGTLGRALPPLSTCFLPQLHAPSSPLLSIQRVSGIPPCLSARVLCPAPCLFCQQCTPVRPHTPHPHADGNPILSAHSILAVLLAPPCPRAGPLPGTFVSVPATFPSYFRAWLKCPLLRRPPTTYLMVAVSLLCSPCMQHCWPACPGWCVVNCLPSALYVPECQPCQGSRLRSLAQSSA